MLKPGTAAAALVAVCVFGSSAEAGVFADDFEKCLVRSSNDQDRIELVKWVFSSFALHPAVKPLTAIDMAQRDALDQSAARLMERLLTADCHKEAVEALKYEGPSTLESAFEVLGEVAVQGLMSHPEVEKGFEALDNHLNPRTLETLGREAGITGPASR